MKDNGFPSAVIAYDSASGVHSFIVEHQNGKIRATCTGRRCEPGEWRPNGPENYEQAKADWDEQHGSVTS